MAEEVVSLREYTEYVNCVLLEGAVGSNANNSACKLGLPRDTTSCHGVATVVRNSCGEVGGKYSNGEKMLGEGPGLYICSSALESIGGPFVFLLDRRRRRYIKVPNPIRNETKATEPTATPTITPVLIGTFVGLDVG